MGFWSRAGGILKKGYDGGVGWALPGGVLYKGAQAANGYYQDQKDAANKAGTDSKKAGDAARDTVLEGNKQAQGYLQPAQGAYQSMAGQNQGPGYLEQLYQKGQSSEPYQRAAAMGQAQMQQGSAARGVFNSGGAQAAEGNFLSGLSADYFKNQAGLASGAQAEKQSRLGQTFGSGLQLGQAQGNFAAGAYNHGAQYQMQGEFAKIQAQLQAAGVDAQKARDIVQGLQGLGQAGMSFFGG